MTRQWNMKTEAGEIMDLLSLLTEAVRAGASDLFLIPGAPETAKVNGVLKPLSNERLTPEKAGAIITQIYSLANNRQRSILQKHGDDDFSFSVSNLGRFRLNAYKQRNSLAAVLRCVSYSVPDPAAMNIPKEVLDLCSLRNGLVLITGAAGSGKSTTLACMIDKINRERSGHIITLEDPIEYLHGHKKSLVSQREVSQDTESYASALRAALRQSPNVILLGEMRDLETIQTALTAVETGQLLLSSLHTIGAAQTVDRIIDVFPAEQQQQVRPQLALVLRAVISQQLIPAIDGSIVPAFEIMICNTAIQNMIRDGKAHQMDSVIKLSAREGMRTMDDDLLRLVTEGKITPSSALMYSIYPDQLRKKLEEKRFIK